MNAVISLRKGALRCDLVPARGGSLSGFWWGDTPVLRETPPARWRSALDAACYPLVPYSNRIGHGQLQWAGKTYPLLKNFPPEPHTIHGTGWEQPWDLVGRDDVSAELVLEHRGNAAWPFDFRAAQVLRLSDHSLGMQLSVTNLHDAPVPAGLGWHPYLVKRPDSRIAFSATGRWEMGPDQLPTELELHTGLDLAAVRLAVDHCFEGWQGPLHWTDSSLRVSLESDLNRLVVFTRPELSCIAIEPVSHANNAFNRLALAGGDPHALGVRNLAPGETFVATMNITVQECG